MQSIGLLRVHNHCLFTWREPEFGAGARVIDITPDHCEGCIAEVRALGTTGGQAVELLDLRTSAAKVDGS